MEAIKFSELPTGDRMALQDEDGVPIIANGENRLLSWGRLKDQLAKQAHTNTVKADETKVPTAAAVEKRVGECEDSLRSDLTALSEVASQAQEKASNAALAASNAQATADGAKADAERFESELDGKIGAIVTAQGQLRTDLETETTNRETAISDISAQVTTVSNHIETVKTELSTELAEVSSGVTDISERIGGIETKIENGEISGGGEEVDLTPITERLDTIEATNATQDTSISTLQETVGAQSVSINTLQETVSAQDTTIGTLQETANTQGASINDLREVVGEHTSSLSEISGKLTPTIEVSNYHIVFADENHHQLESTSYDTSSSARGLSEYIELNNGNTATLWEYCKYLEHSVNNLTEAYMGLLSTITDLEGDITSANTRCTQLNTNVNKLLNEISTQLEEIV